MTLREAQSKFAGLVGVFLQEATRDGHVLTLGEVWRPQWVQDIYVKQGKSQTHTSKHTERLAIDVNLFINGVYQATVAPYAPLGVLWKSLDPHCVWGGDWKTLVDANHFELEM